MHERLSFDVIVQVFQYYQLEESPPYPVETLLLVCKTWNKIASNYPPIWSRYDIGLYSKGYFTLWLRRLPLRLSRSGPKTPLHIKIKIAITPTLAISLLNILAGENGALCAKWNSLQFCYHSTTPFCFSVENEEHPLKVFTYPMPLLTSLEISSVSMSAGVVIFPYLPSLKSVRISDSHICNYPDMSRAKEIELSNVHCWDDLHGPIRIPEVQDLRLSGTIPSLPHARGYKNLRTLILQKHDQTSSLKDVSMPNLTSLSIEAKGIAGFCPLMDFPAITGIHTLYLKAFLPHKMDRKEMYRIISHLLHACVRLRELWVTEYILSILLENWHSCGHLFKAESAIRVILNIWTVEEKLILGEGATNAVLKKVAMAYRLQIPNFSVFA
ncbi:hypothetical protein FRC20_001793 [Serendipita sp. 405]|nr:hypothetical protein FRC20_001793 [Serendipita sp. 405]